MFSVSKSAYRFIENSPALKAVLPKPPRVAFRNPKTLRDKLVRCKIRENDEGEKGNFPCGHSNCEICKILQPGKEFKSTVTGEVFKMNFHFFANQKSYCNIFIATITMEHTMIVQIIDFCDLNDQEKQENIWMHKLRTLYPDGLNHEKINQ